MDNAPKTEDIIERLQKTVEEQTRKIRVLLDGYTEIGYLLNSKANPPSQEIYDIIRKVLKKIS